ncbi:MAG: hypothetical protein QM642_02475 [Edaphocola sp.]
MDNNEMIAEYLNAVLEDGNDAEIITATGHIAKESYRYGQNCGRNRTWPTKFVQSSFGRSKTTICNNNESAKSCWWTNTS